MAAPIDYRFPFLIKIWIKRANGLAPCLKPRCFSGISVLLEFMITCRDSISVTIPFQFATFNATWFDLLSLVQWILHGMRCSIQHPDKIKPRSIYCESDYANVITIQNKPCYLSWHEPERLKPLVEMFSLSQSLSPVHHSKRAHWNQFKFAAHSWSPPSNYVMFNWNVYFHTRRHRLQPFSTTVFK